MSESVNARRIKLTFAVLALVAAALLGLSASPAHAAQLHVSVVGSDTAGDGSLGNPYATVQHAIGAAGSGDEVYVGGGTFTGDVAMKNGVSLYGGGSIETTLTGTGTSPVISAVGIDSSTTISGFTITGGGGTFGSGIYCSASSPKIVNNTIRGNSADSGGGIYCMSASSPRIINNTIVGNAAAHGGGIGRFDPESVPTIVNCIIWDNGDDLYGCSATYSCISNAGMAAGLGNITAAPSFVETAAGDYHLNAGSPCIDTATSTVAPSADKDGAHRPRGRGFDMGAYEFAPPTYKIVPTVGAHGLITPSSTQTVDQGTDFTFTITPDPGYHVETLQVDDDPVTAARSYQFTNVTESHTISATFARNAVGTIMGRVTLQEDEPVYRLYRPSNASYFWTSAESERDQLIMSSDYVYDRVAFCLPKGGTVPVWRFRNQLDGTYLWTADPAERASIATTMSGAWIEEGTAYQLTPGAQSMWRFSKKSYWAYLFTPDDQEKTDISSDPGSSWGSLVEAWTFKPGTATGAAVEGIEAVAYRNVGGSWQIAGTTNSDSSGNYEIAGLTEGVYRIGFFDSTGKRYLDQYFGGGWENYVSAPTLQTAREVTMTPDAVMENVNVALSADTSTHIWAPQRAGGSIEPSGVVVVDRGDSRTFQLAPYTGYHISTLAIDGGSDEATTVTSYTFANVTAPHAIVVTFARDSYTITPTAGDHGSISPSTVQTVSPGGSKQFTITADSGYHIKDVLKDGASIGASSSVTFANVNADHTISASFAADEVTLLPVYRFRNLKYGTHFYTASQAEYLDVLSNKMADLLYEGISYRVAPKDTAGTVPVHRFLSKRYSYVHFYTANETEYLNVLSNMPADWAYEGVGYAVWKDLSGSRTPVNRFLNLKYGVHFYTAAQSEYDTAMGMPATYRWEGIGFYVEPNTP